MFWIMFIVAPMLICVYAATYRLPPLSSMVWIGLFYFATFLVGIFSPWQASMYLAIIPVFIGCRWLGVPRAPFVGGTVGVVVIVIGISVIAFIPKWREIQELSRDYPRERIDKRLAYEASFAANTERANDRPMNQRTADVTLLDEHLNAPPAVFRKLNGGSRWHIRYRDSSLRKLEETHDGFVQAFIDQEGFGLVRRIRIPVSDEYIRLPDLEPLSLANGPKSSISAADMKSRNAPTVTADKDQRKWHAATVANFSNAPGFGIVVDDKYDTVPDGKPGAIWARGFESHGFQRVPEDSPMGDEWQLTRLDLVSLLKHDPPAVYLSDSLPRMEELSSSNFPTRELDKFERLSLTKLRDGNTIVVQRSRNRVRMLGAILAAEQCIQCHNVPQGEMLGAFTYEFFRKEPATPKKEPAPPTPPLT